MKILRNIVILILILASSNVWGQKIPPRPNPPKLVNDLADVLTPDEEARLESKLVAYDDSTSNQIVIVTVKTLGETPIEEFALNILRNWGVGNKKTNNGVVIVAAIDDHKIRIETGYGLEGAIPDVTASQIIANDIAPEFRAGNYYAGFDKATESIIHAAAGEYSAPAGYGKKSGGGRFPVGLVIFIIIMILIFSNRNRRGGGGLMSRRGSSWLGPAILASMLGGGRGGWSGGGGSGGFGGGGFGGFGGGSGGGGGASGSW